jgi:RimJ/RimL family protein N-acetyltransferase
MDGLLPIHTERLILREMCASDEADIHAYASDPEVARLMVWGPNTPEMTRTFLMQALEAQKQSPRHTLELAIELKSENRMIGGIGMRTKDEANRTADIGWVLNRSYWGRGYVSEAARAMLSLGFGRLQLHRVWATCDRRNARSFRVMEKIGMRREGLLLKNKMEKGEWRDYYLYAVLEEEWRNRA